MSTMVIESSKKLIISHFFNRINKGTKTIFLNTLKYMRFLRQSKSLLITK